MVTYSVFITVPLSDLVIQLHSIGLVSRYPDKEELDEILNNAVEWLIAIDEESRYALLEHYRQWIYQTRLSEEERRVYFQAYQMFLFCVHTYLDTSGQTNRQQPGTLWHVLAHGAVLVGWDWHYVPIPGRPAILTITLTDPVYSDYANLI